MGDLSIQDLVVEYSSGGYAVRPLDHFNLDVAAGSLVILLGPSGCGKTTLLSCLGGILKPTSGAIKFGVVDVPPRDRRHRVPGVQPGAQSHRTGKRDGAAALGRHAATCGAGKGRAVSEPRGAGRPCNTPAG